MVTPSIRSLARQLGLSPATVSLALRDSPRVVAETKDRVRHAAQRAGYRPNALVSSVMTGLRRSAHNCFQGTLMALNYTPAADGLLLRYHREIFAGAQRRAAELGYTLTHCWTGPQVLPLHRLNAILEARGVQGVIVMPFPEAQDFSALNWSSLASVVMDHCLLAPALTSVLPDHHLSLFQALERLRLLGYQRPGLAINRARDERLHYRWSAAYGAFSRRLGVPEIMPALLESPIGRETFLAWFRTHRPDAIIGHMQTEITTWLAEIGVDVPDDVGFLQLNWTERTGPCAALDLQPGILGAAAVEAVVAQIHRNECGVPENPKTVLLPARWVEGPTLPPRNLPAQTLAPAHSLVAAS